MSAQRKARDDDKRLGRFYFSVPSMRHLAIPWWPRWRAANRARAPGATCARTARSGARRRWRCRRLRAAQGEGATMRDDMDMDMDMDMDDMDKVIVERPRRGGGVQGDGRGFRNSRERGSHLGMKRGYDHPKGLDENLAPLKRWLHKQVHRPWDKVYAELCSGIDRRSTVQAHVFRAHRPLRRAPGRDCAMARSA
jgi:hypothetical protein